MLDFILLHTIVMLYTGNLIKDFQKSVIGSKSFFLISLLSLHYTKEINRYTCQHFISLIGSFIYFGFVLFMSMSKQPLLTYGLNIDMNIYLYLLSECDVSYIAYFASNCSNSDQ